jgi:uncharacterized protein YecE (DUF72 family)
MPRCIGYNGEREKGREVHIMPHGVIRIGTCSWAEQSLIESGAFYPEGITSAEQRLRYYASRFDTVEVESSFYAIPAPRMVSAWAERTPPGFLFHLKAHGALTGHSIDPGSLPPELRAMLPESDRGTDGVHLTEPALLKALAQASVAALEPLKSAHRLGFIVFQFPPWFGYKKANLDYLLYCKDLMAGLPIAVEFRHGSWLTRHHCGALFEFLREHKISYITCDEPQLGSLATAPLLPEVTTQMAYLRLHGRNAENWLTHATPRYDYLYSEAELEGFAGLARRLSERTRMVFVMFNNCHAGHAAQNAQQLHQILKVLNT